LSSWEGSKKYIKLGSKLIYKGNIYIYILLKGQLFVQNFYLKITWKQIDMSIMVIKSLQKQSNQSNQNQDRNGIDTLRTVLIDRITRKVGSNS
jgi:hypothetical protein